MTERKCLVISGGAVGIGFATAQRFANADWQVVNISRSAIPMREATQLSADFEQSNWIGDVQSQLADEVAGASRICVVHNSALKLDGSVMQAREADLNRSFAVNVVAPIVLNQALLPHLKPGSSIIYVGSTLSHRATRAMAVYTVTKHALAGLMRSTAQDLAGTGIHTVCVCPGFTETEMLRSYGGEALAHLAGLVTQRRLIAPEEIAEIIFNAAHSPALNGAMVNADLGFVEP